MILSCHRKLELPFTCSPLRSIARDSPQGEFPGRVKLEIDVLYLLPIIARHSLSGRAETVFVIRRKWIPAARLRVADG